jgi:hypothetical protein
MNKRITTISLEIVRFNEIYIHIDRGLYWGIGYWRHDYDITHDELHAYHRLLRVQSLQVALFKRNQEMP